MTRFAKTGLLLVGALLCSAVVLCWLRPSARVLQAPSNARPAQPRSPTAVADESRAAASVTESASASASRVPPTSRTATATATATVRDDLNALLNGSAPEKALAAFRIVERCVQAARTSKVLAGLPPTPEGDFLRRRSAEESAGDIAYCAPLTQREIADRVQWLRTAVDAKVPGAAVAFHAAGPNGEPDDLTARPDDLGVRAWQQASIAYLNRDAEAGDGDAMALLSTIYSGYVGVPRDAALSLGYGMALRQARGPNMKANQAQLLDSYIAAQKAGLSEAEIAAAQRLAGSILSKCCVHK